MSKREEAGQAQAASTARPCGRAVHGANAWHAGWKRTARRTPLATGPHTILYSPPRLRCAQTSTGLPRVPLEEVGCRTARRRRDGCCVSQAEGRRRNVEGGTSNSMGVKETARAAPPCAGGRARAAGKSRSAGRIAGVHLGASRDVDQARRRGQRHAPL